MKFRAFYLLLALQAPVADNLTWAIQADKLPPPFSHRQKIKYAFQQVGKVSLQAVDSLSIGKMASFTVFRDGRLSIGDRSDSKVKIFSPDGQFIKSISGKGKARGETAAMGTHCIDDNGHIWILDYGLSQVSIFDESGSVLNIWRPYDHCKKCMLDPTAMRAVNDRLYLSMLRVRDTALISDVTSLLTIYDLNYRPIAHIGHFDENVKEISQWQCTNAVDFIGAVYLLHNNTNTIQKYAPDGKLINRFNFPVKEFRRHTKPQPKVSDFLFRQKAYFAAVEEWYWSATIVGRMEIAGQYLFVSFVNVDSDYIKEKRFSQRHEFLQIFDLSGNCLVDCLKIPGEFLATDSSGILYFRENDDPKGTVISKYRFIVQAE